MSHEKECDIAAFADVPRDVVGCTCQEVIERKAYLVESDALWLDGYEHGIRDAYDAVDKGGRAAARIEALARLRSVTL